MYNIERAKELLENQEYTVHNELTHMEVLNLFEAVAKRCSYTLTLFGTKDMILIGDFEKLTEAMFESEFKMILERANCGYNEETENWFMYT